jgi:hypothetical protein
LNYEDYNKHKFNTIENIKKQGLTPIIELYCENRKEPKNPMYGKDSPMKRKLIQMNQRIKLEKHEISKLFQKKQDRKCPNHKKEDTV